jgi:UDP-N-acetylmuramyl pentapeptide phosphotransferase/UDP-N-acetylglucosamine-1-phosphate transferase
MLQIADLTGTTVVAVVCSFFISMLIVLTQDWHGKHSLDSDLTAIQKFHKTPVPRIGGIAFLIAILVVASTLYFEGILTGARRSDGSGVFLLLLAGMPAFLVGLLEDMTKKISPRARLIATIVSALLAGWLLNAWLSRIDIVGIDHALLVTPAIVVVLTAIAVAGVANSINIIDGFHGIAGSAVVIILAGLGYLAWQSGDGFVTILAVVGVGATLGFLMVNYPTGRLFLGDGGAYLAGYWVAEVAILLITRNPGISTWQVLAICSYPVIEVLFSIYRKAVIRNSSPAEPDRLHMHMLIYRRLVWRLVPRNDEKPWIRSAAVACVIGSWIAAITLLAVKFGETTPAALAIVMLNVFIYCAVYARFVRGRWLRRARSTIKHDLQSVSLARE